MDYRPWGAVALALALSALMGGGCADDDRAYDLHALPPAYQEAFSDAMNWWNERDEEALFLADVNGRSRAFFGFLPLGWSASFHSYLADNIWGRGVRHDVITFNMRLPWTWATFCYAARHELGHHLEYPHSEWVGDVMYPSLKGKEC